MRTIRFTLDSRSIAQAIKEVEKYKREFQDKVHQLRELIAERIRWSAEQGFQSAMVSDTFLRISGKEKISESPIYGNDIQVFVENKDDISVVFTQGEKAVFIEYGAGVYHNGAAGESPHPWGIEKGFVIGSYGKNKGVGNAWGYYDGSDVIITHGTPAAMPMYRGAEETVRILSDLVREVFGD